MTRHYFADLDVNGQDILNSNLSGGGGGGSTTTGARVTKSGNQTIPNNTLTTLTFDQEDYDTENYHDNATNNSRLTIPEDGFYVVTGNVEWATNTTGNRSLTLLVNGSTIIGNSKHTPPNFDPRYSITTSYQFSAGDYVELLAAQTSGGNLDVEATATTSFSIVKVPGGSGSGAISSGALGAEVTNSTATTLTSGVQTLLSWDTEVIDDNDFFDAGSPTIFTIPDDGWYICFAQLRFDAAGGSRRQITIRVNGIERLMSLFGPDGTAGDAVNCEGILKLSAGDTVDVQVRQDSGGNLDTTVNNPWAPRFRIVSLADIPGTGSGGSGSGTPLVRGRAQRDTTVQSLTSGDSIIWETSVIDENSFFDLGGANPERLTINTTGRYLIEYNTRMDMATHAGNFVAIRAFLNGTTVLSNHVHPTITGALAGATGVSFIYDFTAGDYLTVEVFHDDGGTVDTITNPGVYIAATQIPTTEGGSGSGGNSGLTALTANTTVNVTDFATLETEINNLAGINLNGFDYTIQCADGTYTFVNTLDYVSPIGAGNVIIKGNVADETLVNLATGAFQFANTSGNTQSELKFEDVQFTGDGSTGLVGVGSKSVVSLNKVKFGSTTTNNIMNVNTDALILIRGDIDISGISCARFALCDQGVLRSAATATIDVTGSTWTSNFVRAIHLAYIRLDNGLISYTGSATGQRFDVSFNGVIQTNTGGASTTLPGSTSGSTSSGGQYN